MKNLHENTFDKFLHESMERDIDLNHPFWVIYQSAQIADRPRKGDVLTKKKHKVVATFDDKGKAKEYAKGMNALLSKGEKQYYKMKYKVINREK